MTHHNYHQRHLERTVADADYCQLVLSLAMEAMTDNELRAFVMRYCGSVKDTRIGHALGITRRGANYLVAQSLVKVEEARETLRDTKLTS